MTAPDPGGKDQWIEAELSTMILAMDMGNGSMTPKICPGQCLSQEGMRRIYRLNTWKPDITAIKRTFSNCISTDIQGGDMREGPITVYLGLSGETRWDGMDKW